MSMISDYVPHTVEAVLNLLQPRDIANSINKLIADAHTNKEFTPQQLIAIGSLCTYVHRKYTKESEPGEAAQILHDLIDPSED